MNLPQALNLANFLFFAFVVNLPLGFLREPSQKYSLRWFIYIHLSIPFIILLRLTYGFGWDVIPYSVLCAVAGQVVGGKIYRRSRK